MITKVKFSDLVNIHAALKEAVNFHRYRDEMNAVLHRAIPRYSHLTELLIKENERLEKIIANNETTVNKVKI